MELRPCPRCETDLDATSGICPACFYDPAVDEAVAVEPEPDIPFLEKYRGTHYAEASAVPHRPLITLSRTRILVAIGLMAVVALYWALMMVSDMRAGEDHPAAPLVLLLTR